MNAFARRTDAINETRPADTASAPPRPRIYDPYSLATRPLPVVLELFPHPKGVDAQAALRITGGVIC